MRKESPTVSSRLVVLLEPAGYDPVAPLLGSPIVVLPLGVGSPLELSELATGVGPQAVASSSMSIPRLMPDPVRKRRCSRVPEERRLLRSMGGTVSLQGMWARIGRRTEGNNRRHSQGTSG